ncbi:MAG: hypothetical protein IPN76_29390 [Saprospiraceae bacterium]|nr:hypothetical protein [Saprospiraceae bacterium]
MAASSCSLPVGEQGRVGAAAQLVAAAPQTPPPQSPNKASFNGCHTGCVLSTAG